MRRSASGTATEQPSAQSLSDHGRLPLPRSRVSRFTFRFSRGRRQYILKRLRVRPSAWMGPEATVVPQSENRSSGSCDAASLPDGGVRPGGRLRRLRNVPWRLCGFTGWSQSAEEGSCLPTRQMAPWERRPTSGTGRDGLGTRRASGVA
jgi:hypothetical protein